MIFLIIAGMGLAVYFIATLELERRKYRRLWCEEAKRHAGARMELAQWIETCRHSGDACAAHKSTIAKLKMEVTRLHEENERLRSQLPPDNISSTAPTGWETLEAELAKRMADCHINHDE